MYEVPNPRPPLHPNCRCRIMPMNRIKPGTATQDRERGADLYLVKHNRLPSNYINKNEAKILGWVNKLGNLHKVAPGKMMGGDIYKNKNRHLPHVTGRVWREADIDYKSGYRKGKRLVYSNDGLIFVTYDHYYTFIQIK